MNKISEEFMSMKNETKGRTLNEDIPAQERFNIKTLLKRDKQQIFGSSIVSSAVVAVASLVIGFLIWVVSKLSGEDISQNPFVSFVFVTLAVILGISLCIGFSSIWVWVNYSRKLNREVETWLRERNIDPGKQNTRLEDPLLNLFITGVFEPFTFNDHMFVEWTVDGDVENGLVVYKTPEQDKDNSVVFVSNVGSQGWGELFDELQLALSVEEEKQVLGVLRTGMEALVNSTLSAEQAYKVSYVFNELNGLKNLLTEINRFGFRNVNNGKVLKILGILTLEMVAIRDEKALELTQQLDMKLSVLQERNNTSMVSSTY